MNRLVVCIGQAHRHNQMPHANVQLRKDKPRDVKLLHSHLAALFHLRFILPVLRTLQLFLQAYATRLQLNLSPKKPFGVEAVVES